MEDYKEKYEQAMLRMSKWVEGSEITDPKEVAEFVFTELKESEDERIRKEIIQSIQDNMCVIHKDKCIAWLEKKGEQKSNDNPKQNELTWEDVNTIEEIINEVHSDFRNGIGAESFGEEVLERFREIKGNEYMDTCEQKPAWSEEDEHCIELLLPIIDSSSLIPKNRKKCKNFLKSLKERVQPQPNQEWSEEEKARINKIIDVLDWAEEKGRISYSDWEDYVCYVKSLKPQSNQKSAWSEEDKKKIDLLIAIFEINHPNGQFKANPINTLNMEYVSTEEIIDWLKSLKEKYAWKPSNEQMEALEYYMNVLNCNEHKEVLFGLYEQLKSL